MSFAVYTRHPVAIDSRDHTHPGGTMNDNSRNHRFNDILYQLLPKKPLRICDLGCAGGGFVKDCIDDGHIAIGIEGSNYSLLRKRAEWATIPDNLFTADITYPFHVVEGEWDYDDRNEEYLKGDTAQFDVITAWEVMEHLPAERLPTLCANMRLHLAEGGMWMMSVSTQLGEHHVTVRPRDWWLDLFSREGFVNCPDIVARFGEEWIRGPKYNAPESFHLVLKKKES